MSEIFGGIVKMIKQRQILSLTKDRNFKTFFTENLKLLTSILKCFIPLSKGDVIENVSILNTELSPDKIPEKYKSFTLDLRIQLRRRVKGLLQDTETVNVEVQTTKQKHFMDRLLMYSSRLYSGQIKKGEDIDKLLPVYCLVFTTVNLKEFEGIKDYYHVCNIRRTKPPEVVMSRGMCFVIVELDKFQSSLHELVDKKEEWCYLLKNSKDMGDVEYSHFKNKGGIMAEAVEHLWTLSAEETLQELDMVKERARRDQVAREQYVYEEGLEKGMDKGREEGIKRKQKEVALRLIAKNMNLQEICEVTGLSESELQTIQQKK